MFGNIGMPELLVILIVVLLLFGGKRLPDLAKSLGKAIRSFKDGMNEGMSSSEPDNENSQNKPQTFIQTDDKVNTEKK